MSYSLSIVSALLVFSAHAEDITKECGILVLTQENFETAITENNFVLVTFYTPLGENSRDFLPEFEKAAGILARKSSPIKLAKIDATQEIFLTEKFGVQGYPRLIFFHNSNLTKYNGGHTADAIIPWLERNFGFEGNFLDSNGFLLGP